MCIGFSSTHNRPLKKGFWEIMVTIFRNLDFAELIGRQEQQRFQLEMSDCVICVYKTMAEVAC